MTNVSTSSMSTSPLVYAVCVFPSEDSGFVLGEEYQWRVRAVSAGIPGEWSDPVVSDTQQPIGPD
ncbi:hypothetical protein ACDX78_23210, partial [Virgibacillus oceani]